jgi:hypothetical protein
MEQTAVEWFFMTMNIRGLLPNDEIVECYNQAKEMEKQIIRKAYLDGLDNEYTTSEEYYNENYKSE